MRTLVLKTTANNTVDKSITSIAATNEALGPKGRNINYQVTNIPDSVTDSEVLILFDRLMGIAYGRWTMTYEELTRGKYISRLEAL